LESPLTDDELIARVKRDDRQAFEALVRRFQDVAFRTAWLIVRNEQDAEEATQAAFVKAWQAIDRFHAGSPFRPWLLRIVANEAKNRRRTSLRHHAGVVEGADMTILPAADSSPEQTAMASEQSAWLVSHINRLGERDRMVIWCCYALDLSEAEIATVLGCARGTVKSRLHRAIGRLRTHLEEAL